MDYRKIVVFVLSFLLLGWIMSPGTVESQEDSRGKITFGIIDRDDNVLCQKTSLDVDVIYTVDMEIPPDKGEVSFEYRFVRLNEEFIVGMNMYGHENLSDLNGFGIMLRKLKAGVFSWEWYDRIDEYKFRKRQGAGTLLVEYDKRDGYWVISKIEFVGDHVLRATLRLHLAGFDWNCTVYDGSYIQWYDAEMEESDENDKK